MPGPEQGKKVFTPAQRLPQAGCSEAIRYFGAELIFTLFPFFVSPSVRNIIAWILQALLAAMFIFSGGHKLLALPGTMKMFEGLGMPD